MKIKSILVGLFALALCASPVLAAKHPVAKISGIYAINAVQSEKNGTQQQIDPAMLTSANVDGIDIHMPWGDVETADHTYYWTALDSLIAQAAGANKKITLWVMPGYNTPAWVYAEGAKSFQFVWDRPWGPPLCSVQTMPLPWDPIYLEKWMTLIHALGARYSSNITVVGVKVIGVNSIDDETNLPHTVNEAITNGSTSCTGYDDVTNWQAAGYTRTLIETTWTQIAQAYQEAFPATYMMGVLQPYGFPPIDDSGNIFTDPQGADNTATTDIAALGVADFPDQIDLENNGLSYFWIARFIEDYAAQVSTGYQTVAALGDNLPAAMSLATSGGAKYLELYPQDLLDSSLTTDIADARALLLLN